MMDCTTGKKKNKKKKTSKIERGIDYRRVARIELPASLKLGEDRTSSSDRLGYEAASGTAAESKGMVAAMLVGQQRRRKKDGASGVDWRDDESGLGLLRVCPRPTKKVPVTGGQNERKGARLRLGSACTGHAPPLSRGWRFEMARRNIDFPEHWPMTGRQFEKSLAASPVTRWTRDAAPHINSRCRSI